jgi:hypothetical protein
MKLMRRWIPLGLLCLVGSGSAAPLRVIEATAIPFTAFLSAEEFDQRYPGEERAQASELDSGWYVIYSHESINYYFGPILLESTGRDYLAELESIVADAVAQRPSIQNYRLELSFEPSETPSSPRTEPPGEPSSRTPQAPQPPQPTGLWGILKRIFGFG